MGNTILAAALLAISSGPVWAQHATHAPCDDPEPFRKLEGWIETYKGTANEPDIRYLLELRHFVCDQVEAKNLRLVEATALYDAEKARVFRKWRANPKESPPF